MNKKILFLILLLAILVPSLCFAQAPPANIKALVDAVKTSLSGLGAGLAAISFIVAGIMFLSATGNPSRMTIAKGALIAAVVGIVIIILANTACTFVQTFFGGIGTCT